MLPVYLTLLLGASIDSVKAPASRFRLLGSAGLFVAGFSLVFTILGHGASSLGSLLHEHRDRLGVLPVLTGSRGCWPSRTREPRLPRPVAANASATASSRPCTPVSRMSCAGGAPPSATVDHDYVHDNDHKREHEAQAIL